MKLLLHEIRRNPLLWLLVFVPAVLGVEHVKPDAGILVFLATIALMVPTAVKGASAPWPLAWPRERWRA